MAVRDVNGDGIPDLLVSNSQGDLLIILGNGDGTFQPYERADQTVSLAVGDFDSNGQPEFVLSNTSIDQLSIQYGETQSFVQGRSQGLQAPGAVAVADLNGDGNPDIIVVNKGENDILVYLGLGGNRFEAPLTFFTGTDPVGLTVADLTGNGDARPHRGERRLERPEHLHRGGAGSELGRWSPVPGSGSATSRSRPPSPTSTATASPTSSASIKGATMWSSCAGSATASSTTTIP